MWGRCGGGVGASLPLLQVFVYNLKTTTTELIDREEFFRSNTIFEKIQIFFFAASPARSPTQSKFVTCLRDF